MKSNDAEFLVIIVNGNRTYKGQKLMNSQMLWQCTTENCETVPKIQRRGQYKDILICNKCANKIKSQNPDILKKRGKAISAAIAKIPEKWSETAKKNMSNKETVAKISNSMKEYIKNDPNAIDIRRQVATKNNEITGFGTSEFISNVWEKRTPEERAEIALKSSIAQTVSSRQEHIDLVKIRAPGFKVIDFGNPDNLYKCPNGHLFFVRSGNFLKRLTCHVCSPKSKPQLDLAKWLTQYVSDVVMDKKVLFLDETKNGNKALEVDIYSPSKKFGIEFNGNYYHQEKFVNDKHRAKANLAEDQGLKLLQFFEDELEYSENIVKSLIKSKLGIFDKKIGANKCKLSIINNKEGSAFLKNSHLQGSCSCFLTVSLSYEGEIVSLITFRKFRDNSKNPIKDSVEIARYATKPGYQIHGGFSRMLKFAMPLLKQRDFKNLLSYSDRRYSNGEIYKNNGFDLIRITEADMFWYKNGQRYPRQFSWGKTNEQMVEDGYSVIRGAGHKLWIKSIS